MRETQEREGVKNEGRVAPGKLACLRYTEISPPNKFQIFKLLVLFCILLHHASLFLHETIKHQA